MMLPPQCSTGVAFVSMPKITFGNIPSWFSTMHLRNFKCISSDILKPRLNTFQPMPKRLFGAYPTLLITKSIHRYSEAWWWWWCHSFGAVLLLPGTGTLNNKIVMINNSKNQAVFAQSFQAPGTKQKQKARKSLLGLNISEVCADCYLTWLSTSLLNSEHSQWQRVCTFLLPYYLKASAPVYVEGWMD